MALFGRTKKKVEEKLEEQVGVVEVKEKKEPKAKKPKSSEPKKLVEENPFIASIPNPPAVEDLIEGPVISIDKGAVYIDLPPFGTGIIYGKEFQNARDIIKRINVGDMVAGKVV